ncbi:MAG: methyltransferase domain-containing protein [Phycisphaerales bacterium]|jgi:2-polyprenyl-3-methyl-5-hydroxy-6-metoxy-1,4-benzoquinol methylase
MSDMSTMWDDRYAAPEYSYGTQPNDFLRHARMFLPASGRVLCVGEGEGRNAVWLATEGFDVTAVDLSKVGLAKAKLLAEAAGVKLDTIHADLADFDLGKAKWDVIVSIWCHLPSHVRQSLHTRVVAALAPGGTFVLEAYTPGQIHRSSGGPKQADMLMTANGLAKELQGLRFYSVKETMRMVHEGIFHNGDSDVVQLIAVKPAAE